VLSLLVGGTQKTLGSCVCFKGSSLLKWGGPGFGWGESLNTSGQV